MSKAQAPAWQPIYWAFAAVPALVPFVFEAAQVTFFAATRAPNVSVVSQIGLMLCFFGAYMAVPWIAWHATAQFAGRRVSARHWRLVWRLAALGLLMSVLHLAFLATLLRVMHSPPGWGVSHFIGSFFEVWLGYAGLWFVVYAATCGVIVYRQSREPRSNQLSTIEVRQGNRTVLLALAEILWIEASGNYVEIHSDRGSFLLRQSLDSMDRQLRSSGFLRSHRRALVNTKHIQSLVSDGRNVGHIELTGGHRAPLSQRRRARFKKQLSLSAAPTSERTA